MDEDHHLWTVSICKHDRRKMKLIAKIISGACRLYHKSVQGISLRPKCNNNTFLIYKSRAFLQAAGKPVVFPQRLKYPSFCPRKWRCDEQVKKNGSTGIIFPKADRNRMPILIPIKWLVVSRHTIGLSPQWKPDWVLHKGLNNLSFWQPIIRL